ncbi:PAS domain S-box-containing protein [Terrimicrobium sacchariphilum]|uniref:PAS domain S-box-containing protein n=1 Tax=Terrimicrobium sacchariphilum TaxID=690879 RepID=A0A146GEB5_TERSA|nr:PAS domain-containing protein [Terrimicrobium sacchariphilum]GAT35024.1 PAS domain S-box-containing protein [Terrimicrobium sacchariphilum]
MISVSSFLNEAHGASHGTSNKGLARLASDLRDPANPIPPPSTLRSRVLERIDAEPARVETDSAGRIVAINPAFTGLCGYTFPEIRGKKPGSLLQGPETDPAVVDILRQAIRQGEACVVRLVNYHKDGSTYHVEISLEPIHDEAGKITGFRAAERKLA